MALEPYLNLPEVPSDETPDDGGQDVRRQAAAMIKASPVAPRAGAPGAPPVDNQATDAWLKNMEGSLPQAPKPKEGILAGAGRQFAGAAAELGHQVTGLASWAGNQLAPDSAVTKGLNAANEVAGQSAQDWTSTMSPEEHDLAARTWTDLDPHQTIWQGSPHDFIHALVLKMADAAPSTLAMLLPMGTLAKAGMAGKALAYVGATQTGLSIGQIANNIQQEIAGMDDNTLRQKSPAFAQLLDQGMDPAQAREELNRQASSKAPLLGGVLAGAISTIAGRFLTPVMTGQAGMGMLKRAGMGALDQGLQGAGIGASDYAAQETAAHVYDKGRAPDLAGGLHAAGEAAVAQGALGAAIAVGHGRSHPLEPAKPGLDQTQAADVHSTMEGTPENKATGAGTENHVIGSHADETPDTTQWEGEGGAKTPQPYEPVTPPGQVPMDLQGAIEAHYAPDALKGEANYQAQPPHRGAGPPDEGPPGPGPGGDPAAQAAIQEQLPLRGGLNPSEMPEPQPPTLIGRGDLTQQRNLPLEPTERLRGGNKAPLPTELAQPQTVADQLRARAAGNRDMNQPDLLRENQPVGPTQGGHGRLSLPQNRPEVQGNAEAPGARPFTDVHNEITQMVDPQHPRNGVFLDANTVASLRRSGLLERVRNAAGPEAEVFPDFDKKGGALIARDASVGNEIRGYQESRAGSPEEIIHEITGAAHEAAPGGAEVLRRAALTSREHEVQTQARGEQETGNAVRRAAERIPDEATSQRVRAAASRDLVTGEDSPARNPEEAARRITAEAQLIHDETRTRSRGTVRAPHPGDLDFHSEHLQNEYRELHDNLARELATPAGQEGKPGTGSPLDVAERKATEFLNTHKHVTRARQAAEAAHEVSPAGVREFVEAKQQAGRRRTEPLERVETKAWERPARATRAELHAMHPDELKPLYEEALDRTASNGDTPKLSDFMKGDATAREGGDRPLTEEELKRMGLSTPRQSMTRAEMEAQDRGLRSLQEKRINRFYRNEASREAIGPGNSDKMAVSPRRPLSEKQIEENKSKKAGEKHVGFKTFDPKNLLADVHSQKEMEGNTKTRAGFRQMRTTLKKGLRDAVRTGEKAIKEIAKVKDVDAGITRMGRQYLREVLQFGRSLRDGSLGSAKTLAAAKQFIAHVNALAKMDPEKRAKFMASTFRTELERQQVRGAQANPMRLGRLDTMGDTIEPTEATGTGGEQLRLGMGEKFSGDRSSGNQTSLPFTERLQPKFGYTGAERAALTPDELEEMRGLINKRPDASLQKKLALRGGQAEPQGTPLEVKNLSQWGSESREAKLSTEDHSVHLAADAVGKMFEENKILHGPDVIRSLMNNLKNGSAAHDLASSLRAVIGKDTIIGWGGEKDMKTPTAYGKVSWTGNGPTITLNRDMFDYIRAQGVDPRGEVITTILHEFSHVATIKRLMTDEWMHNSIEALRMEAMKHGGQEKWNGLQNAREFVADGYSDPKFRDFLRSVNDPNGLSLWERFKDLGRHALAIVRGQDFQPKTKSLYDSLMEHHDQMWTGEKYVSPGHAGLSEEMRRDPDGKHVGNMLDRTMKTVGIEEKTRNELADAVSKSTEGLGQFGLSAMAPRQMSGQFSKYFERADGSNPYRGYWDTFFKRQADNALSMETVSKRSNEWSKLEDKYGPDQAASLSRIMRDASTYEFHPDMAASASENSHVIGENLARAATTRAEFKALHPDVQAHYGTMKEYYKTEQRNSTDQSVLNGLHAMLTKGDEAVMTPKMFDAKYNASEVRRLELDTTEGLQKEFGDKLDESSQRLLAAIGKISKGKGPYFPLTRHGDYVVTAKRQIANKAFATSEEAQAYARDQRGNDATLAVKVNKDEEEGGYHVSVTEREIRMAESKSEAARHQQEMSAQYGEENTSPVQLKADLYQGQSSITTGSALDRLIQKLEGNPAAQAAIKDFYLRSLGEQSFRKRELARANWRGVDPENQHRAFVNYGQSQSYWLSQLKWGRHLANAQAEVHQAVRAHRDESQVSAVRMGQFAKELAERDKISRSPYEVSDLLRKGTSLTQFYMLTSPSHWFVRAAQPYMLTAPWLGARHGYGESTAALLKAQKMIASPLLTESAESGLGLKAIFSKLAAEKTYSVMDQVMSHLTSQGADPKINDMLRYLRNNNLIDLSMATELSDIGKGRNTGVTSLASRVLDAGRTMLHLAEVNNRTMTAIAARELGLKQGMTEQQSWEHAADAINVTHNDYSYGNTPRLFMSQAKGVLGGARPLIFQFMKYPQQVYGMMASSMLAAFKGKTPLERKIGMRTFAGVMATHMVAAGAIGASIAPMKWAIGAMLAGASALGYTDKKYTVANALSGDTYDHIMREVATDLGGTELGELLSKGLPAALGVDLSQRMALGSTYTFHLKTDSDDALLGSLMQTFGGPWLNVATNFFDAGKSFMGGNVVKGIQQMSPHILRDLVKAGAMSEKGVVNNAGTTLVPADKLTGPELFAQAMGFRPEGLAEVQDRNNAEKTALQNIQGDRKDLIQKYISAEPNAKQAVWTRVQEFNKLHPGFTLNYSELRQAAVKQQDSQRAMQQYGARLKTKQIPEITREGAPYNTR
jgi:hypothetical protein